MFVDPRACRVRSSNTLPRPSLTNVTRDAELRPTKSGRSSGLSKSRHSTTTTTASTPTSTHLHRRDIAAHTSPSPVRTRAARGTEHVEPPVEQGPRQGAGGAAVPVERQDHLPPAAEPDQDGGAVAGELRVSVFRDDWVRAEARAGRSGAGRAVCLPTSAPVATLSSPPTPATLALSPSPSVPSATPHGFKVNTPPASTPKATP